MVFVIIEIGGKMPRIRKDKTQTESREKIWKVAPYIRLSRDDGSEESMSVTNQKKIISEFFEREFHEPYEIVDWYIDDGVSGTTGNERPEFQRAIEDMKIGRINCITCKALSRAFRNYADQGYYLEQLFPTYNLRFISIGSPKVDTHLDPSSIIDGMEVPINGLMNDRYAARTSQDIRRTFDMKRRKGEFIGAFAPYGLKKNPENKNHLLVDEDVAPVVRDIFNWRGNLGMSKGGIARKLNELGIPNPIKHKQSKGLKHNPGGGKNDGLWGETTIRDMLKSEMYIGNMVQGKHRIVSYKVHKQVKTDEKDWYIVKGTHEPIVELSLFEKVQEMDKRDTRVAPSQKTVYLFSGFMYCADCDRAMRRKANSRKRKTDGVIVEHVYYTCSTRTKKGTQFCKPNSMREELLRDVVLKAIQTQIERVTDMAHIITSINKQTLVKTQSSRLKVGLADKHKELKKITHVTESLYMDWKMGEITKDEYQSMKLNFEEKANGIKSVIENIEKEIATFSQDVGEDSPYLKTFMKYKNIRELNRTLLTELIDRIELGEDHEVTITFRFQEQQEHIMEFIENNQLTESKEQTS